MKKFKSLLIVIVLFSLTNIACSQDYKHEFAISYGIATTDDVSSAFGSIFEDIIDDIFGDSTQMDISGSGVILLTYQYHFSKIFSAGPVIGYEALKTDVTKDDQKIGSIKHNTYTLAVEGRCNYLNRPIFGMFFGLGFGVTLINSTATSNVMDVTDPNSDNHFNFHITALGFRVGKQLGATAELGFGYRGIANLGVFYRF